MAQDKELTAIEIAARLGITDKSFRRWLRDQVSLGNPLVTHHRKNDPWVFGLEAASSLEKLYRSCH